MSSDSEDDLVVYGTPLEPLEEDEIPKKRPCLLEDQIVTDKQGRRRFHGAFTGGFSAGFFNTVGTLEGWKPSSFKSSKSEKQNLLQQRPEDFMDEEDFGEFGIAPLILKAKQDYTTSNKRKASEFFGKPNLGTYILKDLLRPVRQTVGIKLLMKMGWKLGQGVGPAIESQKKIDTVREEKKVYGCSLPTEIIEKDEELDIDVDRIKFPSDVILPDLFKAKNNFQGIGYEGLEKRPVLSFTDKISCQSRDKPGSRVTSQAFGVGAFEEEDEDIFSKDDISRYDFSLDDSNNEIKVQPALTFAGVLDGFVAETKKPQKKFYPKPLLPKNFRPRRKRVSRFEPIETKDTSSKNVESMSSVKNITVQKLDDEKQEEMTEKLIENVQTPKSSFKPFQNNLSKQERYEKYLKLVEISKTDCLRYLQPSSMTEWDKEREKAEFEKAAQLFKPLTGGMEDRFQTASQPDDVSDPLAVVEKFLDPNDDRRKAAKMNMFGALTRLIEEWTPSQLLCKRFNIPEPKSYGKITEKKPTKSSLFDSQELLRSLSKSKTEIKVIPVLTEKEKTPPKEVSKSSNEPNLPQYEENPTDALAPLTENKIDLFKAIFLASDDEDEENKVEKEKRSDEMSRNPGSSNQSEESFFEEKLVNTKRNDCPPSGIFENIDLQTLNARRNIRVEDNAKKKGEDSSKAESKNSSNARTNETEKETSVLVEELMYGPKIPEKIVLLSKPVISDFSTSEDEWTEKKTCSKKKKKKEKKKKKDKKFSSKPKHKKHKR